MKDQINKFLKMGLISLFSIMPLKYAGTSENNYLKNPEIAYVKTSNRKSENYKIMVNKKIKEFLDKTYTNPSNLQKPDGIHHLDFKKNSINNNEDNLQEIFIPEETKKSLLLELGDLSNLERYVLVTGKKFKLGFGAGHGRGNEEDGVMDWGEARYVAEDSIYREADMVLNYVKNLEKEINSNLIKVSLIREDNEIEVPLEFRPLLANALDLDLFISIHVNNYTKKWWHKLREESDIPLGFEILYRNLKSRKFAEIVYKNFEKILPLNPRQIEERKRIRRASWKVLENLESYGIIVEPGYLSYKKLSNKERKKYNSRIMQDKKYLFQIGTPDSLKIPYIEIALLNSIDQFTEIYCKQKLDEIDSIQNLETIAKRN